MTFSKESDFEESLIKILTESCGWEPQVLRYKTEKELLQNWADILFENNRGRDQLNDYPLTEGEMHQLIEQIEAHRTPLNLNGFINGKSVTIKRDNENDKNHYGKEVTLKIYDRQEIAAGQSRYQIAQQPKYSAKTKVLPERRGDFILLINGMPLIHVELKKSGISVAEACEQIKKYSHEGVFSGLFSLVQVFVAMNPEEAVYFANPGPDGIFNPDFFFHWADFNNEPINDWKRVASTLLSIPMAHQLIGFYTVADRTDGVLKVMRSYQYYAANKISDAVAKHKWEYGKQLGGYIWHTTGSGKTMTSFKSAQLIANSKDADKVVFLMDRIELGTQSAGEYRGFAEETDEIQETEDTAALIEKLKSTDPSSILIVTSIQKMSNIKYDADALLRQSDLDVITSKRIVFIVDECHRSSFGEMMQTIKQTFPRALLFGFSGTPIQFENQKKGNTTADVFGNELHRYSIADGIRDKNVLGFDPVKVLTFKEKDIRKEIALNKAGVASEAEVFETPAKKEIYYHYMREVPMAGYNLQDGQHIKGIEDFLLENGQYRSSEHQRMVVTDILDNWMTQSSNYKFHGIFATSSIPEAVEYYKLFKEMDPELKVTALFDPTIDNKGGYNLEKEDALVEIITDYNERYKLNFSIPTYPKMKKDIQNRLAHKKPYERIQNNPAEQLDLLIVVDQMLTGYDSKWINVLYLDKVLRFESIIQAFSRTNRLFGPDKRFGTVKYYRAPFTMDRNIEEAVKVYSGDKPLGLFVIKLDKNLENMNAVFTEIKNLFEICEINNFEKLPDGDSEKAKFAKLFKNLNDYLDAAKIQGFIWDKLEYDFEDEITEDFRTIKLIFDEKTYRILAQRYKELAKKDRKDPKDNPFNIDGYLMTINTEKIDNDYMNSRFEKYLKALENGSPEDVSSASVELHKTFASLSQEEQKYANLFLHDIQTGDAKVIKGKSLRDYINEYMERAKNDQIHQVTIALGVEERLLRRMMKLKIEEDNINEYGRLDNLKATVDKIKAKMYFENQEGKKLIMPKVNIKTDKLLRDFILSGGFELFNNKEDKFEYNHENQDLPLASEEHKNTYSGDGN